MNVQEMTEDEKAKLLVALVSNTGNRGLMNLFDNAGDAIRDTDIDLAESKAKALFSAALAFKEII